MNRVLVTGASGFIGRQTLEILTGKGFEVVAVSRQPISDSPGTIWVKADLLDPSQVRTLIRKWKPRYILHLAWDVRHGLFWNSNENLDWVGASLVMAREFAEAGGHRFVCAGTCAEYSWEGILPLREDETPLLPATLYGQAKKSLFELLSRFSKQSNISFAWGRIFFMYGPHEDPRRLIRHVLSNLVEGKTVEVSDCSQIRDFLAVEDVARAFCEILTSEIGGPINIGSGEGRSLREVLQILEDLTGKKGYIRYGKKPRAANDPEFLVSDNTRLRLEVGWSPKYPLIEGISSYIDWIKS